jgi:nitrogen fixation/metabolism regulation signal transduction histidine kinase
VGQVVDVYNAIADALGRERSELRQRELLLDTMLESSDVAIILANAVDRIIYGSRAARRLFGGGRRIEGRALRDLVSACPEPLRAALLTGGDSLVTVTLAEAEESFHVSGRTFEINSRRHTMLMVRHLTPELRRQEVAIWKKVIRIIGHEIGNSLAPVRSLVHSARLIRGGAGEPERLDSILDTIDESAARLHRFVDSYARFARLPEPRLEDVDLPSFLAQLQAIEPFRLAAPVPRHVVRIDSAQIQQALINLLKNAREAGSPSGDVEVAVDELPEGGLGIRVADRGRGMSPETLAKALLPYYSTKRDGSGLGLALSREIVEAHGGRLHIANRKGGGVEVTCTLLSQ